MILGALIRCTLALNHYDLELPSLTLTPDLDLWSQHSLGYHKQAAA